MSLADLLGGGGLVSDAFDFLNPFNQQSHPPILTQLPQAQNAFVRKYTDPQMQLALNNVPLSLRNSLVNLDLTRVQRGQQPLSAQQTLGGLSSVVNQQPYTQAPEPGLLGRIRNDIFSLVDVPHMVSGLVNEVQQLPQAPEKLSEALGKGNIQDIAAGLQQVPGVRDIPGVYSATQLLSQGPGGLLEHPVFSALDILPFAEPALGSVANSLVQSERFPETAARVADAADTIDAQNSVRSIYGLPQVEKEPWQLAVQESPAVQRFRALPPVQKITGWIGRSAQDTAQLSESELGPLRNATNPNVPLTYPGITTTDQPLAAIIRDMYGYVDRKSPQFIEEARRNQLTSMAELNSFNDAIATPGLNDNEVAFLNSARDHANNIAQVMMQHNLPLDVEGGEIYPMAQAGKLRAVRQAYDEQQMMAVARNDLQQQILGASGLPTDGSVFPSTVNTDNLLGENVSTQAVKDLGRIYQHQIGMAGFDTADLGSVLNSPRPNAQGVIDAINQIKSEPTQRPVLAVPGVDQSIDPFYWGEQRDTPGTSYAQTRILLRNGHYGEAATKFSETINRRTMYSHPESELVMDSLKQLRDAQDTITGMDSRFNDRKFLEAQQAKNEAEKNIIPARFYPKIQEVTKNALLAEFSDNPAALQRINQGLLPVGMDADVYTKVYDDAVKTVLGMKAQGFDPIFIHHVSPGRVPEILYPRLSDVNRVPSSVKERMWDATPYVRDAAVAVSHQAAEALTHLHIQNFLQKFTDLFGKTYEDLEPQYMQRALRENMLQPGLDVRGHLEQLIQREYKKYDPSDIFPTQQVHLGRVPNMENIYIPRALEGTLKDMFRSPGGLQGALDPVMNAFRMSVLAFSPRFHFNNIFGGAMLAGIQDPRILYTALSRFNEVRNFAKEGGFEKIPGMTPRGMGQIGPEVLEWMNRASPLEKALAHYHVLGSNTLRKWYDQYKGLVSQNPITGTGGPVKRLASWSYHINSIVDDFYRAAAYLTGRDTGSFPGLSGDALRQAQQQAGVALVRKVLPEWDRITPFERNIVRNIFPFYTFAKFTAKYAMHYPIDHPFRMAVMNSLARNEAEDYGDWLPLNFSSMFFLGHPDKKGMVNAITPGGINPFQDLGNYFTWAGWVQKSNPLIASALESMGIDTSKGAQDLYPGVNFDPRTGTLQATNQSFLSTTLGNIIPQSQVISSLIGANKDFGGMMQANPQSALRYLRSGLGLPNIVTSINVPQTAIKEEVQRQTAQDQVRNEALRTGDWSKAMQFPKLVPFFSKLGQLMQSNPQVLQAYQSAVQQPGGTDSFVNALLGTVRPGG